MYKLTIIIKALNEEKNIARAIKSAIRALKGYNSEIILVDSLSTDRTIEIAKKYPVKIIQITKPQDRSCGVGPQIGFLNSKGDYIYILDGDMELNSIFIGQAIKELESDKNLAGVAGIIYEVNVVNAIFRGRKGRLPQNIEHKAYVDKLMMGGIYKKAAIKKIGYFSNPYLHSYEESDLGYRLTSAGYKLIRIPTNMVKHYGHISSSTKLLLDRWKSRYLWGCGELLRYHLFKSTFFKVISELKIYILTLSWWICFMISLALVKLHPIILKTQLLLTFLFLMLFLIKKRNLMDYLFSILSWHITSLGLLFGFLRKSKPIGQKIDYVMIKE